MAGTAEGDCAARDAGGSPTQSRGCCLDGPVGRHPGCGAIVTGGGSSIDLRDAGEAEHAISTFARAPNGGLILTGTGSGARRELIITLAARHRLPAVYPFPFHVTSGGLTSYGPDVTDNYRLPAPYRP